jgi:photosystem II stability/assembly factor-like uncharacterized protein
MRKRFDHCFNCLNKTTVMPFNKPTPFATVKLQPLKGATQEKLPRLTTAGIPIIIALLFTLPAALFAQYAPTPAETRVKEMQQRKEREMKSMVRDVKFRNVGPVTMSGRVVDIDANPADPTEFYVAYATGGLWHTVNNGLSFTPIFDNNDHLFMGDIAVDWRTRTIWVGTGEVNSSRSTYAGTGVFKTTNNGKSWEYLGLPESHHIGKIVLHPTDANTAWVAAMGHLYSFNKERGVYKTTDGGKTWKKVLFVDDKTGVVDMEIDPLNPNNLYAAAWYRTRTAWNFEEGGASSGIYKSTDGGNTWSLCGKEGSGFPVTNAIGRIGLAIYPKNPNVIYAIVDNQGKKEETKKDTAIKTRLTLRDFKNLTKEQFAVLDDKKIDSFLKMNRFPVGHSAKTIKEKVAGGSYKPSVIYDYLKGPNDDLLDASAIIGCEIYRSDDAGATWKKTNTKSLDGMYSTYGYYFGKIWVSPINADKVYITGVPVMMSADSGKTFKNIEGPNVHSDHHAVWINPSKDTHIINGNDGGVNITYDDGKVWFKANSIPVGQFYSIEVDEAKPYNVYGGLQDNGVWYGPSVKSNNSEWFGSGNDGFKNVVGGDGMMINVDTRDNSTMYAGSQFGFYQRLSKNNTDRKVIRPRHQLGETPLRYNWETPILLSKHNQDVFYMGSNRFHRSLNKADTIITLSSDLTKGGKPGDVPYGTLTSVAESPLKFGLLYTGSDDGLLHVSKDGGYNWTNITGEEAVKNKKKPVIGLPKDLWVSCITPSAFAEARVYVSFNGYRLDHFAPYLFVSEDYGATWNSITGDLPTEAINAVKEDPKNENILYVATDQGLYVSIDRGKTYMPFTDGLPRVPVHDIAIQKRENEIVLGTHGRSIYIAKLDWVQKLLTDKEYYDKKKAEADKVTAVLNPDVSVVYNKEGVDENCPPVKR